MAIYNLNPISTVPLTFRLGSGPIINTMIGSPPTCEFSTTAPRAD
jgi:hypothetical protein